MHPDSPEWIQNIQDKPFLVPVLEKFRVVGVGTVDYVRRTNHEIERIFLQKIVKILSKMKLQSDLNAEMDGNLIFVSFF